LIKHEFIKRVHLRYREEGIACPITTVYMKGEKDAGLTSKASPEAEAPTRKEASERKP
jgi:hypothetical protein